MYHEQVTNIRGWWVNGEPQLKREYEAATSWRQITIEF
jgi:hypothetical protein